MKTRCIMINFSTIFLLLFLLPLNLMSDKITDRVENSIAVYKELIDVPDQKIPSHLLNNCIGIAVFPGVKKAAFGIGGRHGKGVVCCRSKDGKWSPPGFASLSGGSFGFQIGGSSTDLVLFIMSEKGIRSLLKSKFTLGADASVAAGPVGRTAEASTDVRLTADIYAYARSKGLFAGIALDGNSIRPDKKAIKRFYGKEIDVKTILFERRVPKMPQVATRFVALFP